MRERAYTAFLILSMIMGKAVMKLYLNAFKTCFNHIANKMNVVIFLTINFAMVLIILSLGLLFHVFLGVSKINIFVFHSRLLVLF